jgi:hypothetical protein
MRLSFPLLLLFVASVVAAALSLASSSDRHTSAVQIASDVSCASEKLPGLPLNIRPGRPVLFQPFDSPISQASNTSTASQPLAPTDTACVPVPFVNDKCPAWNSSYDGPGHGPDGAGGGLDNSRIMATSSDGQTIYVVGTSDSDPSTNNDFDYVVVAFDTSSGEKRWQSRYAGSVDLPQASPYALALSPNGASVFVTGTTYNNDGSLSGIGTAAFSAATGELLWTTIFTEPSSSTTDLAVSADGTRVFVAGEVAGQNPDSSYRNQAVTIAYDAATGKQLWLARYSGGAGERTYATKVATSPDGTRVYVAGGKLAQNGYTSDILLLIYDPISGELLRETHHPTSGVPPAGIVVSPDGSRVFVEEANLETLLNNALTIAYDATGTEIWTARFRGCDQFKCSSRPWYFEPITVSPDGSRVFVTSLSVNVAATTEFYTVAYNAATGAQEWATAYEANVGDCFCGPVVRANPNGNEIYVSGYAHSALPINPGTGDATTIAYDPITGTQRWIAIHKEGIANTYISGMSLGPDGTRLFLAGDEQAAGSTGDLIALAYDTPLPVPLQRVVTRKTHGSAGTFDVDLPLVGARGIECRSSGGTRDYTMIFTFVNDLLSVGGASLTNGSGTVSSSMIDLGDSHRYIVSLTGVSNAQFITVTLSNVIDSAGNHADTVSSSMGILIGDTTNDGTVNSGDIVQTKSQSGIAVTSSNFREDLNADGFLNSVDISLTKSKSGTVLP